MDKFRFLKWKVYADAKAVFSLILKIVDKMPKQYRYELGGQIIRSALSIVLNIAEGSGKSSEKELNRYFDIALGSLHETVAAIDILKDNEFMAEAEFGEIFKRLDEISKELGGFKKSLS